MGLGWDRTRNPYRIRVITYLLTAKFACILLIDDSPRACNRFIQVVEAKRFEGVILCRKVY